MAIFLHGGVYQTIRQPAVQGQNGYCDREIECLKAQAKRDRIWQRRFWEHAIRDPEDFNRHVDYIHWNPVKHGHVQRVGEWPYRRFTGT
jgi:REP element-mobilizing transposase RayT